jgi:hypothetical protein
MDKLSGLASKLGGSHSASGTQTQGQPQGEQKDYVDRGNLHSLRNGLMDVR